MTLYKMEVFVEIDEELLSDHDQDKKPPPHDLRDWYCSDLGAAIDEGIAEFDHCELGGFSKVEDEDTDE